MKKFLTLCLLAALAAAAFVPRTTAAPAESEPEPWLWPVEGLAAGEGIRYAPQSHIGSELNFADLFIGAPEGTPVVAPTDGVVAHFGIGYLYSLENSISGTPDSGETLEAAIVRLGRELGGREDPRCVGVTLALRTADGRTLYFGGMRGERIFRTGERVQRGERLGTVGYSYKHVDGPSLSFSVSDRRSRADDPMTPFGIRTTFIPPQEIPQISELSREEAAADFEALMRVLREAYPGIHDDTTPAEVDAFCEETLAALPAKMPLEEFSRILRRVESRFHDSHLSVYLPEVESNKRGIRLPNIYFGWVDSALVAVRCTKDYAAYYGRRIRAVDGIPADSLRRLTERYVSGYDARVRSVKEFFQALWLSSRYFAWAPGASPRCDATLEFEDGERLRVEGWNFTGRDLRGLAPDWTKFARANRYPDANFSLRLLDDSTAYMGLSTFQLSQVEVDSLAAFLRSVADRPNLIVDVRNNGGGSVEVLSRILSFFTDKPFRSLGGYQWMARTDSIGAFENCCDNYTSSQRVCDGFVRRAGQPGWFCTDDVGAIAPDSLTYYGGRLYVLVNEGSCSAATIFPATLLRNHRGLIVGRETATAYHFMNALKFADIRLPHSWLRARVPLVRCVFDTTSNARIPYGRGVIPDHEIRLSLDEMASVRGDSILNYTLALIRRGEYLGEDPFAEQPAACGGRRWRGGLVAGLAVLCAAVAAYLFRRRR